MLLTIFKIDMKGKNDIIITEKRLYFGILTLKIDIIEIIFIMVINNLFISFNFF